MTSLLPSPSNLTPLHNLSSIAACSVISSLNISVLIDLNGLTLSSGLPVLRHRCAPTQFSYLGLPQTTGETSETGVDLYLADSRAIPVDWGEGDPARRRFSEKLALLTGPERSYIANDYGNLQGHAHWRFPVRNFDWGNLVRGAGGGGGGER